MDNEEKKVGRFGNLGKGVLEFKEKTQESIKNVVDKNGDGKIDASDFEFIGENAQAAKERAGQMAVDAGQALRVGSDAFTQALADSKLERERKTLCPVFISEFYPERFDGDLAIAQCIPNMIRIVEHDRKRDESVICQGSVGYRETIKGVDMLCIYDDCVKQFGLHFYPNAGKGIYYLDPYQDNFYVSMNGYFAYLRQARVNELELVAQKLGAKRLEFMFKEKEKTATKKGIHGSIGKRIAVTRNSAITETEATEIKSAVRFSGHNEPGTPELVYFKNDSDIESLVKMRTSDDKNAFQSKTYRYDCSKYSNFSDIEAAKIDAVLGYLKYSEDMSFSNEVQKEKQTYLEYTIEFE